MAIRQVAPDQRGRRKTAHSRLRAIRSTARAERHGAFPTEQRPSQAMDADPNESTAGALRLQRVDATASSYRWWVLFVTSIGALLASLTSGTLVIALPDILRDLHTDLFALMWIVVGYTLVATVLVLNAGRVADMFGRARTYTLGFAIFTLASVFCAIAGDATQLIAGRVVQGIGGAFLMANSAALVTDAFPRRELGRALGINAMVVGAGLILGPILGGWLTSFGWRTVFWFNVPIGVIGTAAAWL